MCKSIVDWVRDMIGPPPASCKPQAKYSDGREQPPPGRGMTSAPMGS